MYKSITILCLALTALLLSSCTKEKIESGDLDQKALVGLQVTTRGLADNTQGVTIGSARFVAVEPGGRIVYNTKDLVDTETQEQGVGRYLMSLKPGYYELFVVVNETAAMTTELDAAVTRDALKAIKIASDVPFTEANVVLMDSKHILLAAVAGQKAGKVSTDGGVTMLDELEMKIVRAHIKTTLSIRKNTTDPTDEFTIKKVDIVQAPKSGWLLAAPYDGAAFETRTLYTSNTGIAFSTNATTYTSVVTDGNSSNIFPEYLLSDSSDEGAALYYIVSGEYKAGGGSALDVYYKFPLRRSLTVANYDLLRNTNFEVNMTITKRGEMDAIQINYAVTDWEGRSLDVDIEGNTFLDVTNIEVNAYDAATTRIYFYTNKLPADRVYVRSSGVVGSGTSGPSFQVQDIFYDLTDGNKSCIHYEPTTGQGYIDLINLNTDTRSTAVRKIYLHAGQLEREITVTSIVSAEAAKKDTTTYVGTFHRNRECGERIVTWHAEGDWTAEIVGGLDADKLRLDRLISPSHLNGQLYTATDIVEAEGAQVTDGITQVTGRGRVYFRVGWDNYSTASAQRYAKIQVKYTDVTGVARTVMLYCRQGEEPDRVVSTSTRFATYNIALPQAFVQYPSMSGYLYQWNQLTPWMPSGEVNNFPTNPATSYNTWRYACPPKYAYPDQDALVQMGATLTGATYHWGYYADGYFDRRAVNNHSVTGPSGEVATAGGLFYLNSNARGIFLPSAGYRDELGKLNGTTGSHGRYWSSIISTTAGYSQGLQITSTGGVENKLSDFDRSSAFTVRCMRLEGSTITFSANGGDGAPRPITIKAGESVILPAGPTTPVASGYGFYCWNEHDDGSGQMYKEGETISMFASDKVLYAFWLKGVFDLSGYPEASTDPNLTYNNWTGTVADGNNGSYQTTAIDAYANEKAYPKLQFGDDNSTTVTWDAARASCTDGWRLPRISELYLLQQKGVFPAQRAYWTATEVNEKMVYKYFGTMVISGDRGDNGHVRCVREIR